MRVRNKYTGIVCEKSEAELAVLPDMYDIVDDETPLTQPPCCGADDTIEYDNDTSKKEED
nr:MAG TPA: hypothetical protein [Caudoviricetes sp.]